VQEKDVRDVLTQVETSNLETGIVYTPDASSTDKVKAEGFLAYLDDPASKSVFEKYVFVLLK
jgi:ABC-type molybdate transport system substrate-binding protein